MPTRTKHTIRHDRRNRWYDIFIPDNITEKAPVMLSFHGGGGNPSGHSEFTEQEKYAEKYRHILVTPAGSGPWWTFGKFNLTWNANEASGYARDNNIDDVGFIETVIDDVNNRYDIDTQNVYANGISNGGFLCYYLSVMKPNLLKGICPVGASMGFPLDMEGPPLSVIHIHGTEDRQVPYEGGEPWPDVGNPPRRSVQDVINYWITRNKCSNLFQKFEIGDVDINVHNPVDPEGKHFVLVRVNGGGHTWPGQKEQSQWFTNIVGNINRDIHATDFLYNVFRIIRESSSSEKSINILST